MPVQENISLISAILAIAGAAGNADAVVYYKTVGYPKDALFPHQLWAPLGLGSGPASGLARWVSGSDPAPA